MINKKIIMFVGMVLLAAGVAYASGVVFFGGNSYKDSGDKLVLDMDLTEANYDLGTKTFADGSGEGNDGVSNNAASFTTDKYGVSTGAMSFNGSSDYVNAGNDESLKTHTNNVTIVAWIYFKGPGKSNNILLRYGGGYSTGAPGYTLYYSPVPTVQFSSSSAVYKNGAIPGASSLGYGNWYFVTYVFNREGNLIYYLNGEPNGNPVDISSSSGADINQLSDLYFGVTNSGLQYALNGSISQLKIYNRSLSATEVMALYNSSKPKASAGSSQSGLVGHWALDSESEKVGSNLVSNSGTSDTTDWVDTNSDGLADDWGQYVWGGVTQNQTNSIVEGQKVTVNSVDLYYKFNTYQSFTYTTSKTYRISLRARVNATEDTGYLSVRNGIGGADQMQSYLLKNADGWIDISFDYVGGTLGTEDRIYFCHNKVTDSGEWFEIDEVLIKEIKTTDKTPYENHGINYGATLTTDRMGHADKAMSFDGGSDYVNCGEVISLGKTTVTLWFKSGDKFQHNGLLDFAGVSGIGHFDFNSSGNGRPLLYLAGSNYRYFDVSAANYLDNNWHFLVLYINGSANSDISDATLSIDKVNIAPAGTMNSGAPDTWNSFYIGRSNYGYFNGSISNVRVYDRALSADEINALYSSYRLKAGSGSLKKGLILDMPLKLKYTKDETVGSEIMTDRTPYSNDGQNYGATVGSEGASFDGSSDYLKFDSPGDFDSPYTVVMWVKADTALVPVSGSSGNRKTFFKGNGQWNPGIWMTSDKYRVHCNNEYRDYAINITDTDWHMYGEIFDGTNCFGIIDGIIPSGGTRTGYDPGTPTEFYVGTEVSGSAYTWDGKIQGVKIYNRVLSDSETKLLYDKGR